MPDEIPEHTWGLQAEFEARGWWHSFKLPDGRHVEGVCSVEGLQRRLAVHPIPDDLSGMRVLDIGAWDGWFSFEMERRGADVMAVDVWDNPRFHQMKAALNSRVEYRQLDVFDLTPARVGQFDIVLFMGVLYHLKHPLLALERICAITRGMAVVDSFVLPGDDGLPRMAFYETDEFAGRTDNWCAPNLACLMAFCRTAGFARAIHRATLPDGACISCYRNWDPGSVPTGEAPQLAKVFHHWNFGINFDSRRDEYVSALFDSGRGGLTIHNVMPLTGGFGTIPLDVTKLESGAWQANFKLPPGLAPGWHDVKVAVAGSPFSAPLRIAVDLPVGADALEIETVCDATTWERNRVDLSRGYAITLWMFGLPENADRANVRVHLGDLRLQLLFVGGRQINALIPDEVKPGHYQIHSSMGRTQSNNVSLEIAGRD
jgi:tRNA (mo5U34)-methyltransferase